MGLPGKNPKQMVIAVLSVMGMTAVLATGLGIFKQVPPPQRPRVPHFRTVDRDRFGTALSKVAGGGEPASVDGAAQEDYDNRAYPAASIAAEEQLAAAGAASAIARFPGAGRNGLQVLLELARLFAQLLK